MLLQIEGLQVAYGRIRALRGVDLHVDEGETVALLGGNGAGKTTTLRTISGLLTPIVGSITFDGQRIDGLRAHEIVGLGIGHVPEGRRIFPRMSVLENLGMGAYRRRGGRGEDTERIFELFPALKDRRHQSGGTLSGGEQQMLAIGRALMGRAAAAPARRAVDGARPAGRREDLLDHPGDQRPGHDGAAGGAERRAGPAARLPGLRARDRRGRHVATLRGRCCPTTGCGRRTSATPSTDPRVRAGRRAREDPAPLGPSIPSPCMDVVY